MRKHDENDEEIEFVPVPLVRHLRVRDGKDGLTAASGSVPQQEHRLFGKFCAFFQ